MKLKVTFDFWKLAESIVLTAFAIGLVFLFAWMLGQPVDNVVGWVALGMAAGANR
jgi:hypothetical protein